MDGAEILVASLRRALIADKYGNNWQYHSRSDRHSKVACWGIAFDLLQTSSLLRRHVAEGKVVIGVNHTMRDFGTGRKKDLDLVLARPAGQIDESVTLSGLAQHYDVELTGDQRRRLAALPDCPAPRPGEPFHYDGMIARMANEYDTTFAGI